MKYLLAISIILLFMCDLKADEFRFRNTFQNENYIIELQEEHWVLSSLESKESLYSIKDQGFGTMSILISDDGEHIVVVDDFSVGSETDNRTIIWLFVNGELIKKHKLFEIIDDECNITISVSHISWCLTGFQIDTERNCLSFSTNEMYNVDVNLNDGSLNKYRPDGFSEETIIAYGKIQKLCEEKYRLHLIRTLTGQNFESGYIDYTTSNIGFENVTRLIAINDGIETTPQQYLFETLWLQKCKD